MSQKKNLTEPQFQPTKRTSAISKVPSITLSERIIAKVTSHPSMIKTTALTDVFTVPSPQFQTVEEIITASGFELGEQIGEGGFATVYKARRLKDNTMVACKVVRVDLAYANKRAKAKNELYVMEQVQHPYIVKLFRHFLVETPTIALVYMFMRLAEGDSLSVFMSQRKRGLAPDVCQCMFAQILSAVQYMHQRNIAHRDIKCENILLDRYSNCLVSDFGLSRVARRRTGELILIHKTSGTPRYMAPEVLTAFETGVNYDPFLTDVWSLGVLLYYLVNKRFPFRGNEKQMLAAQWKHEITFGERRQFDPGEQLVDLLMRTMEPNVKQRITMDQLVVHPWIARHVNCIEESLKKKKQKSALEENASNSSNGRPSEDTS